MPILSLRCEGKTSEGEPVPGAIGLQRLGLRLPVVVGIHGAAAKALSDHKAEIPHPIPGEGIIDTGASVTSIDNNVAHQLGLAETGIRQLGTAAGPTKAPTYAFRIGVANMFALDCPQGVGCDLIGQGITVLLGMDVLSHCILIVNGPDGSFNLAM